MVALFFIVHAVAGQCVFAETVQYDSSVVWRTDHQGDFVLPHIPGSSAYETDHAVVADHNITSITATWVSEGTVHLDVSVDDGVHYISATNGVPISEGLSAGHNIRWRARVAANSRLSEVTLTYQDQAGSRVGFGSPDLSGFRYRKPFRVWGSSAGQLNNYQVLVKVGESLWAFGADVHLSSHGNADFSDVRFTLQDGVTVLPQAFERVTGSAPNRVAEFYVRVPQIPPLGVILYVNYGNRYAKLASEPERVFDFYQDLSQTSLDSSDWRVSRSVDSDVRRKQDGWLISGTGTASCFPALGKGVLEYSATPQSGPEVALRFYPKENIEDTSGVWQVFSSSYKGAEHCLAQDDMVVINRSSPIKPMSRYIYRLTVTDSDTPSKSDLVFEREDFADAKNVVQVDYKSDAAVVKRAEWSVSTRQGETGSFVLHWVRTRQQANFKPIVEKNLTVQEEEVLNPVFVHTRLALNGDVILDERFNEGAYFTPKVPISAPVQKMTASWQGSDIVVDFSADGGKSYLQNGVLNEEYCASCRDFESGQAVRALVNLKGPLARLSRLTVVCDLKESDSGAALVDEEDKSNL